MEEVLEQLKTLANEAMEVANNKTFPIYDWLKRTGIDADILFPYEAWQVGFGTDLSINYHRDEWILRGSIETLYSLGRLKEIHQKYRAILTLFKSRIPELKAIHVQSVHDQIAQLMEDLERI